MSSPQKKFSKSFAIHQDGDVAANPQPQVMRRTASALPLPLTTSRLANQLTRESPKVGAGKILHRTGSDTRQKPKLSEPDVLDVLMAKLNEQQQMKQGSGGVPVDDDSSSVATDPFANTPPAGSSATPDSQDNAEIDRLKRELDLANERMAQMQLDLTHSHLARQTVEQAIGSPFPAAQDLAYNSSNAGHHAFNGPTSRRTSPFEGNNQSPGYGINGMLQAGQVQPPTYYHGQNEAPNTFMRPQSGFGHRAARANGVAPTINPYAANFQGMHAGQAQGLQAPIGTRLSPTASNFDAPWQMQPTGATVPTYMNTTEPLNYRRLLDRNMSCNWRYVVDKIVCNNDQQASIFLQQKLKVGTQDQKFEIVQAIIDQAYPLMINRFGNFLVQRCFEHGTPDQIVAIAQAIRGNTLNLSMDAFGCHVVQKAFDSVPEEYKAIMVHELLRRIPETVIHRYACHVWQKLFELRWSGSPPQIMKYVNEALRGMWHEVALGETGSLVVQNIFENCLEEDKRPCISEVLASIDVVAHGQFGNWCIQHICEHGAVPDRSRAVDHVLRYATEYSMDQFASKVVEKCLKIGGSEFLDRYLDRVCEARPDRPRMPLVDIAGDQFGNYLIQYILTNADQQRREIVAAHIRKHMVSLRGSKYGSRVAMLCCNPAFATRPGPPTVLGRNNRLADPQGLEMGPAPYANDRGFYGMRRNYR